ncbi:hypothetical protein BS50DRAFT_481880 [Corynespora cassiicola Philippines]|uniref:Homeobox domain-containing protein n=1 Tax=Corynespora cassiicola Philippines TaxID=1448308 RepID=A0A2T2P7A8_CORCC|nr:hypothetical protein BS50DRAFT_481880 [Corynespora cassiicola Philippines]
MAGLAKPPQGPPPKHNGVADVKPRLTKEQHDILEAHFRQQHKPSTSTKKGFADTLGVPLDKINNWFQNRRAKVKQEIKKAQNQYMNMGMYGSAQLPIVNSQFPTHHPEQHAPHPAPMGQDFYAVNADISPTCMPVQSVEGPSALELASQISLQQPFDMHHSLRSIPEADRPTAYHPGAVMQSFMAATAGPSYLQPHAASLPQQESGFSYDTTTSGLPQTYSNELSFPVPTSLPNDSAPLGDHFPGFSEFHMDFPTLGTNNSNPGDVHTSAGSISSEPSPFSGAQSNSTTQSSGGPNASSVTSIASVYSGWTDERSGSEVTPANQCDDPFETPYSLPQASASEHTLPFWAPSGPGQAFSQADMYQHHNASAHAILSSPDQGQGRKLSAGPSDYEQPIFGDEAFSRRNSSTSNLATNIEAIQIQNGSQEDFKLPNQPSSIAARRHKRPTALNSNTLRSASYTSGMPSPGGNGDHTLRRIRSSGIPNAAGRVQKPNPGSAQRSPMTLTFADAAASPKFARSFSSTSVNTVSQGGSLAPPTPMTPNDPARFPYWQSNTVIRSHPAMPDHSSPESLNANWSVEPHSAGVYSNTGSPPSTPLDLGQLNQARLANETMYRDTPPQSAPATQQNFSRATMMQPPQMRAGFHSTSDLTIAQPKPSHFRRPSLPDGGHGQPDESQMHYPVHFGYDDYKDISLSGISHNVPFAPPVSAMPDFLVHEYAPPSGVGPHAHMLRRTTEPQPKSYIFANQSPADFKAS